MLTGTARLPATLLQNEAQAGASVACFHCGTPSTRSGHWHLVVDGAERVFCCAGCLAVAQTISAAKLERFYAQRSAVAERPSQTADAWSQYDQAAEAGNLIRRGEGEQREVSLLLEGIRCAACVWLIESYLQRQPGVLEASVNFATRRAHVCWDARAGKLSDLLRALSAIGYRGYPYDPARREALARRESRALLLRMAIALLAMMQVMMFAVPAYVSVDGVEPQYQTLLDWASLALTLPVVLYCAAPFFAGVLRDLKRRRLGMDVPVAFGVGGAFIASALATLTGVGAVYYDSVTMFVALLLFTRYVELRARMKAADAIEAITRDLPATAQKLPRYPDARFAQSVPASTLAPGDIVRVSAGDSIPADGEVLEGRSSVEEAVLTGESWPRHRRAGDKVLAGTLNRDSPLMIRVSAAGAASTLAALARLVERAAGARPPAALLADRAAAWFVAALLVVAAATFAFWWQHEAARALAVTLAVLVVSCPCALSLATPAAIAAAVGALGRQRILAVRGGALETLARVSHVIFDKTGTLTRGDVRLLAVSTLGSLDRAASLGLAAALEQGSTHPLARALLAEASLAPEVARIEAVPGCGVEGVHAGRRIRIGRPDWVAELWQTPPPPAAFRAAPDRIAVALGDATGPLACLEFGDSLRPGALELVSALRQTGVAVSLLSGDRDETAAAVARAAGIDDFQGEMRPVNKREFVAARQREGAIVAMIGDGVNDAPGLAQADVSLSLGGAAALTQWTSDIVVLGEDLRTLASAFGHAKRTFRTVRQNLLWALAYNVVAIPLAATGYLTPAVAALGMSASSLLVVGNALRLARVRAPSSGAYLPAWTSAPASAAARRQV
ncbi:MAG TPA: heavy metal translocating P-type ATPase [Casimicrobiaceae bacterium]